MLYYELAANIQKEDDDVQKQRPFLTGKIKDGSLKTKDQVIEAVKFVKKNSAFEAKQFDEACGVGVVVDDKEIVERVNSLLDSNKALLDEMGYRSLGQLIKMIKDDPRLKWADGKCVKDAIDAGLLQRLGPKDSAAAAGNAKAKPKKEKKPAEKAAQKDSGNSSVENLHIDPSKDPFFMVGDLSKLHKPGENKQIRPELMEEHLKATGGIVMTRFPPEPNGHLHIGHAKAINVNFGYAKVHGGKCYLRYDDTNPAAEEEEYFDSIKESVEWLGFKPHAITYSSDYFQRLYDLAVEMIKKDKGYVCHCTGEEMHAARGGDEKGARYDCSHRSRPIAESLREFQRMKEGYYKEGEATLRMKMDMQNPNPQFWDLVAYRVLYTPHFRTKSDWVIYPTYDYTHCLCDSFENITHSMCTVEFRASRESYYWLCDVLDVYKPVQWEYGRLNITKTVLSKRKLNKLVSEKIVSGWDDPRLYTLKALKRRGVPAEAINRFVRDCGVSTADSVIDLRKLDFWIRQYLDDSTPRTFAIMEPLPLILSNLKEDHYEEVEMPYAPPTKNLDGVPKSRVLPFTRHVFIDKSDFKEDGKSDPNFYRLSKGSTVGLLKIPYPVYCRDVLKDKSGNPVALDCLLLDPETQKKVEAENPGLTCKPKAHIQWLAYSENKIKSPQFAEFRIYNDLFLHDNPMDKNEVPGGWLSDINPNSLEIKHGLVEPAMNDPIVSDSLNMKPEGRVQFVRTGYFAVDKDTKLNTSAEKEVWVPDVVNNRLVGGKTKKTAVTSGWVWNRTISLREDVKKD